MLKSSQTGTEKTSYKRMFAYILFGFCTLALDRADTIASSRAAKQYFISYDKCDDCYHTLKPIHQNQKL